MFQRGDLGGEGKAREKGLPLVSCILQVLLLPEKKNHKPGAVWIELSFLMGLIIRPLY